MSSEQSNALVNHMQLNLHLHSDHHLHAHMIRNTQDTKMRASVRPVHKAGGMAYYLEEERSAIIQ